MHTALLENHLITAVETLEVTDEIRQYWKGTRRPEAFEWVTTRSEMVNVYQITYTSNGHSVIGFLAEPKEPGTYPCIIVNRGGSKELGIWTPEKVLASLSHYAHKGYVVVTTQYSGCGGSEGKEEWGGSDVQDVLIFRELLQNHPSADAERIGMIGYSRGGMMTYRALAEVDWIKAAISRAGVSNVYRSHELRPEMNGWHADMFDITSDEEMQKRSAVCWPEKFCKTTPLLLIHGTADASVSVLDTLELGTKLYEQKVPFRMHILEGADHFITEHKRFESDAVDKWFERFLKNDEPLPNLELHSKD